MAEPKVGMKFSSYLNMSKAYNEKSAKTKIEGYDRQIDSNPYNKIQVFNTTYFNKNGVDFSELLNPNLVHITPFE